MKRLVGILLSDDQVDVSCMNPDGDALFVMCENGHQNIVRMLLCCGKDGVNADTRGMERSHRAPTITVWDNHECIVCMLLDAGATVNSLHEDLGSPLFYAPTRGRHKILRTLLERGTDFKGESSPVLQCIMLRLVAQLGNVKAT
ncbi:hypothetical protein BDV10DRAFT_172650 [Aspergillus recurvatus]